MSGVRNPFENYRLVKKRLKGRIRNWERNCGGQIR
jgi:hypothetical protein